MKNKKRIVAILASTALTLGVVTPIFAADTNLTVVYSKGQTVAEAKPGTDATNLQVISNGSGAVGTSKESNEIEVTATTPTTYSDLAYTAKDFLSDTNVALGTYPVFNDAKALNEKLQNDLNDLKEQVIKNFYRYDELGRPFVEGYSMNDFSVSFTAPENHDQYAKVVVTAKYDDGILVTPLATVNFTYYVDKANMSLIDKAAYDAGITAQEEAAKTPAVEEKAEIVLVPLRKVAVDKLGYKLDLDAATGIITVSNGKTTVAFKSGENKYVVDGVEKTLEVAPTNPDGTTNFVPTTFFSNFFNVNVSVDADNNIIIAE